MSDYRSSAPVPSMRQIGPAFLIVAVWIVIAAIALIHGLMTSNRVQLILGFLGLVGSLYMLIVGIRARQRLIKESRRQ